MIDRFAGEYRFLSNFYPCHVNLDGLWFHSVEHAYQAAKTFDMKERLRIWKMNRAGDAKKAGNQVKLRPDWESVKLNIMRDLLVQKFKDPELKKQLLDTRPHDLVEGNDWGDKFWGVCDGVGENWLGKLLMQIRESLASSSTG